MRNRSKRFSKAAKLVDKSKSYAISEAVDLAKKASNTKFDAGLEVHIRLGIDSKKADQLVRGSVVLPHGTGKTKKIAVFCEGKEQEVAKQAGAKIAGGDELIAAIKKTKKCDFELALATPAIMKKMGQIAKILGPKGLMPNPRNETITKDIAKSIKELSQGKVTFRNDESGNIHQLIGRISFDNKKLEENYQTFIDAIRKSKSSGVKGSYIRNITICATMGPGIKMKV
ncbi:50S ribosomal protein L1 [Patescibacteria group bacterium]|nr:50S ribosomal protein L1 [Patescibacteria group bacterium]MBU0964085.1 50S ribosomal protein L1 [Patescibacteria group bacterium]